MGAHVALDERHLPAWALRDLADKLGGLQARKKGRAMKYRIYSIEVTSDGGFGARLETETELAKIADLAVTQSASGLGKELMAILVVDGKIHKVVRGGVASAKV